ncbi:SNO glutamine amidotransferase family protein, partial [Vibrio parahaemolyticus V-223/04]
KSHCLVSV